MKRNIVIATLTAVALAGGTVAAFAAGHDEAEDRTEVRSDGITAVDAIEAALRHTPGTVVSAQLEDDGADAGAWGVDVVREDGAEYDVEVSGGGEVLGVQRDSDERDSEERAELAALKGAKVDARAAALAAAAKGTVTEVGADDENDAVVWGVETVKDGTTSEWTVTLDTGEVTKVSAD
ncbi:PepSY domain-containing protein [Streptomyces sp. GQFP]|uniref:PepSY domain-containing protein n=1 Tax=Streptomyces sp. GQFP TaxID=2907545 RepID=UPI001F2FBA0E|nr:PepSY domain-containing protein [Streptomyces sp. GQFP]UIX30711.1 PepSY domain-containing protein [Streptomyces sp. GQFP]